MRSGFYEQFYRIKNGENEKVLQALQVRISRVAKFTVLSRKHVLGKYRVCGVMVAHCAWDAGELFESGIFDCGVEE